MAIDKSLNMTQHKAEFGRLEYKTVCALAHHKRDIHVSARGTSCGDIRFQVDLASSVETRRIVIEWR